jgi:hypothetical protein
MFGGGYTQLNEGVGEIINGKAGFLKLSILVNSLSLIN